MEHKKTGRRKKYVKYMGNAACALSILFVLYALAGIDLDISEVKDWRIFFLCCFIGVCLKTGTVFVSGSAWRIWLEFFSGKKCDEKEALRVYAKANIGKYIPGNVMHYVERNLFAGKLGLSQKQMAAASISEAAGLVFTAFFLSMLLAYDQLCAALEKAAAPVINQAGAFTVPVTGILLFLIMGAAAVFFLLRYQKKRFPARGSMAWCRNFMQAFLRCFFLYGAVLLTLGFILVLVYGSFYARWPYRYMVLLPAAYMIAWVLGFIIPGAPGGIGVRELVLTLLLSPVVGKDSIVALGVIHRLITILGDFAAYFLRILIRKRIR